MSDRDVRGRENSWGGRTSKILAMRLLPLLALTGILARCTPPPAAPDGTPAPATASAAPRPTGEAGAPAARDAGTSARCAEDAPDEPEAPRLECLFARHVRCIDVAPTRTALQPTPFEWCPKTIPRSVPEPVDPEAHFSPCETRAERQRAASDMRCCYVEFAMGACR
jgi:hypothetical protein